MARSFAMVVSLLLACTSGASASRSLHALQQNKGSAVAPLLQDVFTFWLKYGPDKQYGEYLSGVILKC